MAAAGTSDGLDDGVTREDSKEEQEDAEEDRIGSAVPYSEEGGNADMHIRSITLHAGPCPGTQVPEMDWGSTNDDVDLKPSRS